MSEHSLPPDFVFAHQGPGGRARQPAFKPAGVKYPSAGDAWKQYGQPTHQWTYSVPWSRESTIVMRYDKADGTRTFRVVTQYKGGWYINQMPATPYPLYRKSELHAAETVYVCEGEGATNGAWFLGFVATTSLGGPYKAAMADWSSLEEKHVVILRDFDDKGLKYAEDVAQLVLAAGAYSAKIVTLPGLNEGEGIHEWMGGRQETLGKDALRAEIEALALAAPRVERETPPLPSQNLGAGMELQCLSEVAPETLEWAWTGVIPRGMLTLITGGTGIGKSFLTLEVAAAVTRGDRGPQDEAQAAPGAVILYSGQDNLAKTVRPRLEAAGANVSLVYALKSVVVHEGSEMGEATGPANSTDRQLSILDADLQRLQQSQIDVGLVVIDPIRSFLVPGDRSPDVGHIVSRLVELASRSGAAIVVVSDSDLLGTAISRAARSVWLIAEDLDDPQRRLLLPCKTNLCAKQSGLAYSIQDGIIHWELEPVPLTGDQYRSLAKRRARNRLTPEENSELARAIDWLKGKLDGGRVHSIEIHQESSENGISYATLRRAFSNLGCTTVKDMDAGRWYWQLPIHDESPASDSEKVPAQPAQHEQLLSIEK